MTMPLRQFFEYYRPWKALFFLDFGCAVVSGLLELAFPLAVKGFIDVLLPSGNLALTLWAAVGLLIIYLVNAGLMVIVIYWGHKLGINIETEMRRRAFAHLQRRSGTASISNPRSWRSLVRTVNPRPLH